MFKTNMRKISLIALAFVMVLSLGFGIKSLSNTKTADAAAGDAVAMGTIDFTTAPTTGSSKKFAILGNVLYARTGSSVSAASATNGLEIFKSNNDNYIYFRLDDTAKITVILRSGSNRTYTPFIYSVPKTYFDSVVDANKNGSALDANNAVFFTTTSTEVTELLNSSADISCPKNKDNTAIDAVTLSGGYYCLKMNASGTIGLKSMTFESAAPVAITYAETVAGVSVSYSDAVASAVSGTTVTLPTVTVADANQKLGGWSVVDSSNTAVEVKENNGVYTFVMPSTAVTATPVLVAANQIKYSYDLNGGAGEIAGGVSTKGATITLSSVEPTKEYYAFAGWSYNNTTYAAGSTVTLGDTDATFVAQWNFTKESSKSINFIDDGVSAETNYNSVLEAAGYEVTGNWLYEKIQTNVDGDNLQYMGIKGNNATIVMFLTKSATVTIAAGGNASSKLTLDGAEVKSGAAELMVKSYNLEAGAHTLASTVSGKNIFIKFINIQYEDSTEFIGYSNSKYSGQDDKAATLPLVAGAKDGYTFIGWTNGNGLYAPGANITEAETDAKATKGYMGTIYSAVYAKVNYLGAGVKVGTTAIRYGYSIELAEEDAALLETINASASLGKLYYGKDVVKDTYIDIAKKSIEGNVITFNCVMNMTEAQIENVYQTKAAVTIGGVTIEKESEAVSATTIATRATAADSGVAEATKEAIKATYKLA